MCSQNKYNAKVILTIKEVKFAMANNFPSFLKKTIMPKNYSICNSLTSCIIFSMSNVHATYKNLTKACCHFCSFIVCNIK